MKDRFLSVCVATFGAISALGGVLLVAVGTGVAWVALTEGVFGYDGYEDASG